MTALREKTVILVTHQVEFLSEVDTILIMEGGKVIQSGSYENLLTAGTAFELLVSAHKDTITDLNQNNENKGSENEVLTKNQSEGEISSIKGPIGTQLTQEEERVIDCINFLACYSH
ncbi:ABC transporter C family member 8-like protein [Trifolium pratense]|uniref:ABC transporter C family member 8-like protein n=1 Tax=Trifolium pratense TaxID=57577 RepID=A0A2K3K5X2_TRIPR|nr:ABC transporter C family member 8-like protein [Trifolium pratense]